MVTVPPAPGPEPPETTVTLPERVRLRVLRQAADVLSGLGADEIPAPLRAAARFAAAKRAQLAGAALAATIDADAAFRAKVAQAAEAAAGPLSDALRRGAVPPAADPVQVGALAYLLRPPGWAAVVDQVRGQLESAVDQARGAESDRQRQRLQAQLEEARQDRRAQAQQARAELAAVRLQLDTARRQLREFTVRLRAAEQAAEAARADVVQVRRQVSRAEASAATETRRLRQRLADAEDAVEAARRTGREARSSDDARLWLLVETLAGAAQGLRRELALAPPEQRPGDAVAGTPEQGSPQPAARGDDPELLDRLLALPLVHVVVDGYNVTKSGYGELPLQMQRGRLVTGLGVLAAQTGAEVTCVFDGAERPPLMPASPRGVRVLFSASGQTADDVIRRFVAAEPRGRAVVVVSSDREVADGIRRSGAYSVAAVALLRRLGRS